MALWISSHLYFLSRPFPGERGSFSPLREQIGYSLYLINELVLHRKEISWNQKLGNNDNCFVLGFPLGCNKVPQDICAGTEINSENFEEILLYLFRINPEEPTSLFPRLIGLKIHGGEFTVFSFTFKFNFLYPYFGVTRNSSFFFPPGFLFYSF